MKYIRKLEAPHHPKIDERFHQMNLGNIAAAIYWLNYFMIVKDTPGDVVECGIGRGRSLLIISAINKILEKHEGGQRRIFGYDSFCGFPEPSPHDNSERNPKKGDWSTSPSGKYCYSPEFIINVLREAGLETELQSIKINKGYFKESLKDHPERLIAILHIDCDLYQSHLDVLEALYPKVAENGLIVFDDILEYQKPTPPFPGAIKAVKEFLGSDFERLQLSISGSYFFVKTHSKQV